jgi:hypothetical protein
MMVRVYIPVGHKHEGFLPLAPRLGSLQGRKVGLLWNEKANADLYLREFRDVVGPRYADLEFEWFTKSPYVAADADLMHRLRSCDAVVTAFGD